MIGCLTKQYHTEEWLFFFFYTVLIIHVYHGVGALLRHHRAKRLIGSELSVVELM